MKSSNSILSTSGAAVLLLAFTAACSSSGGTSGSAAQAPTVQSNSPVVNAVGVPVNASMSATFSETMDAASLTAATFTLTSGAPAIVVPGTVTYSNSTAVFWPAAHLADNTAFTATITTGALDATGVALEVGYTWGFTTGNTTAPGVGVNLGLAGNYAILAKAGISTVPPSAITGNLGISPAAATAVTGFGLIMDGSGAFSTSAQVTGNVYAADYAVPTPSNLTTAVLDMQTAFTDAAGRAPDVTELGAGNIGGLTLAPGVYKWGTGVLVPTDVTLNGSATDVWIFQIAQDLTVSNASQVVLTGGALPQNVFWQVTGLVSVGTTASFNGVILTATAVTLQTGAVVHGRLLAQTAVNMDGNTVVEPAP
jgi:hypothetical protein